MKQPFVVTPWVNEVQRDAWLRAWGLEGKLLPPWLVLVDDSARTGCARAKNRGITEAVGRGAEIVVVLDDDCYPDLTQDYYTQESGDFLEAFTWAHGAALEQKPVQMFATVTDPPSRGTPFHETTMMMPVAASMGFWSLVGDYDAVRQLAFNIAPMTHRGGTVFARYFPLCGMNLAFRPKEWRPWCTFIDIPRYDDIWMGWLWQKEAYRRGHCFNLDGPVVRHVRQSNPYRNLVVEAQHLERNETLWREIARSEWTDYYELLNLLPEGPGGSDR